MAERVARALNLLGANGDLLSTADTDALLELIDDYLAEEEQPEDNQGNPTPATQPFNHTFHENIMYHYTHTHQHSS